MYVENSIINKLIDKSIIFINITKNKDFTKSSINVQFTY